MKKDILWATILLVLMLLLSTACTSEITAGKEALPTLPMAVPTNTPQQDTATPAPETVTIAEPDIEVHLSDESETGQYILELPQEDDGRNFSLAGWLKGIELSDYAELRYCVPYKDFMSDNGAVALSSDANYNMTAGYIGNGIARTLIPFPHPKIVQKSETEYYFVYQMDNGFRAYLQFDTSVREGYTPNGYVILMAKALNHQAFEEIAPGSSLSRVAEVDPIAEEYRSILKIACGRQRYDKERAAAHDWPYAVTMHLLTDGILQIEYEYDTEREEFFVTKTTFSPDFTLKGAYDTTTCYKILPEDYVEG